MVIIINNYYKLVLLSLFFLFITHILQNSEFLATISSFKAEPDDIGVNKLQIQVLEVCPVCCIW